MNIPSDKRNHDYKNGGYQNWLTKVESVKLDKIKPEKVQAWKIHYIRENGTGVTPKNRIIYRERLSG